MSSVVKLRPHHLLCTQGYNGLGYDDAFVENMTAITTFLRGGGAADIVFSTDDICQKCPRMISRDLCESNDKVKRLDKKVADYFGIEEKKYIYPNIVREINAKMTCDIMDDICGECEWYPICKERMQQW